MPPPRDNFFHSHAVFGKNWSKIVCWRIPSEVGPPLWEILDPPLLTFLQLNWRENHASWHQSLRANLMYLGSPWFISFPVLIISLPWDTSVSLYSIASTLLASVKANGLGHYNWPLFTFVFLTTYFLPVHMKDVPDSLGKSMWHLMTMSSPDATRLGICICALDALPLVIDTVTAEIRRINYKITMRSKSMALKTIRDSLLFLSFFSFVQKS